MGSGELREESCIILDQEAYILDAPLNHGKAVETHAESIASHLVRVVEVIQRALAATTRTSYL